MQHAQKLGTEPIPRLLIQQAIPSSIGILVLSIYAIIDTIFVGRWVGSVAIAAITVVLPITFLIASVGMSIGVGGASIISRALGANKESRAQKTFGNQISMTLSLAIFFMLLGYFMEDDVLRLFGAQGDIVPAAKTYFGILLPAIPFLAFAMMSNNVLRAEGKPKVAMVTMLVPALVNLILDPIFIIFFDMGLAGAAWATTISYVSSASYSAWFFLSGKSEMRIIKENFRLQSDIVKEIFSIGSVTFARQGTISLLAIILNNSLFVYGGTMAVSIYGIISRSMMFANFPVLGITQGFIPIAGYNYGAKKLSRVKDVIKTAIKYGTGLALVIFAGILLFSKPLASIFTTDIDLIQQTAPALVMVFFATPLLAIQLIGAAYYQAIGQAIPALLLTLTKQGFCLIPLILILPIWFGITGIWISFPLADLLSAIITFFFLRNGMKKLEEI